VIAALVAEVASLLVRLDVADVEAILADVRARAARKPKAPKMKRSRFACLAE
jgi:hypothetical protein